MHPILFSLLKHLAKLILWKQHPIIIAVTGSVGKTSTKEAILAVLKKKYSVRATVENYNNEIGVPLTIIGATSGGRNPLRWLWVCIKAIGYGLLPLPYPRVLIIEMGADKPGDIKYLTQIAPAQIGIVTAISDTPAHLQAFSDVKALAAEKLVMLRHLTKSDIAIVNLDDEFISAAQASLSAKTITISATQPADVAAVEIDYSKDPMKLAYDPKVAGTRFKVKYIGSTVPVFIPGAVGKPTVYSALFAIACGLQLGINLVDIVSALQHYHGPNGRLRLLPGKQHSVILDDTYNSSPAAAREALRILHELKTPGRRIAVLGVMAELGNSAKRSHAAIGKYLAGLEIDLLVTIGNEGDWIAEAATDNGFNPDMIHHYASAQAAAGNVAALLQPDDIILVKGSQVARLEKVVRACLEDESIASDVLVRQYGKWAKL
ncbi:MAG: UDP-N-acetylmuramoyl-tripeptide--D-alanyl-D-alanine ligase [Patescibacteria group bacterium]|jgi:UDP-N-acetylmuramoyl-tripeptide--D-alanyl-D-alanine ligase